MTPSANITRISSFNASTNRSGTRLSYWNLTWFKSDDMLPHVCQAWFLGKQLGNLKVGEVHLGWLLPVFHNTFRVILLNHLTGRQ